ncbi:MAG: HAD family hydrolase [Candidatus Marinimicrobia bacterium]|nr:HAD family hydrolase [Candidatus Neomarinimicrobiota bacterium]
MNSPAQYKHIIWDWNGTLLNDGWLFVEVMNTVLIRHELETITLDRYREIFGFPVKDYYKKLGFDFEKVPFEESGIEFIKGYENRRYDAELYPQAILLLTELCKKGISNSILSAQHQTLLNDLTNHYKISNQFTGIIGLDNHYAHSKIENGIKWVKQLDMNPQEILMIGDTDHDFEVAAAMGVDCILLSHGHHCISRLQSTGAKVYSNLSEISDLFNIELNTYNQN